MMTKFKSIFNLISFLAVLGGGAFSCQHASESSVEGLSASADADNVAVLLSAYSYTPGIAGQFQADYESLKSVVSDPAGNYRFKVIDGFWAGHYQMLANIRQGASQVSADGTLMVFITAHGATNGSIEPQDQAYATLGYLDILGAIREGRKGKPFRRLVLFISACYSGSWLYSMPSSGGLFSERLVLTSVGPNQLSYIGQASAALRQAFEVNKKNPAATMQNFVQTAQAYQPAIMYSAEPASILAETMINEPAGSGGSNGVATSTPTPTPTPSSGSTQTPSTVNSSSGAYKMTAMTVKSGSAMKLYIYVDKAVDTVEYLNGAAWLKIDKRFAAQPAWQTIAGFDVALGWGDVDLISVRVSRSGQYETVNVPLKHK